MPTPGSPAINTTEPGTTPEPSTRSSSRMPDFTVFVAAASTFVIGLAGADGVSEDVFTGPEATGASSWSVPQDPHSGQRPSHLGEE